jgi:hypothetical protein
MKQKITYLVAMLCLTALVMSAQPLPQPKQPQRACDIVRIKQQKGKTIYTPAKQVNKNASEAQQQANFRYYSSRQSQNAPRLAESELTDTATVTLMYNLQEEEFGTFYVYSIMAYNSEWSEFWQPIMYTPEGSPVKGLIVKIPFGTYDLYTNTYEQSGEHRQFLHIDELITIDKDTTIYLDVINSDNLMGWDIYNSSNELLIPQTVRYIDHDPWIEVIEEGNVINGQGTALLRLDGYGYVNMYSFMYDSKTEDRPYPIFCFINGLSDRYKFCVYETTLDNEGMIYINRLNEVSGTDSFPLMNDAGDYVAYEEQIKRTSMGIEAVENPLMEARVYTYLDNILYDSNSCRTFSDDGVAHVMINAKKNGNEQLEGVNMSVTLGVMDYSNLASAYIDGPEVMVNQDRSFECLVHDIYEVLTPEIGVRKDDYPAHPMFSYTYVQKKGVVANSCPLIAITSNNKWDKWSNGNTIYMSNKYMGRNAESIGSGNYYSTMMAKYNNEVIWNGKYALDSLSYSWRGNPDGEYELEFTNANVAVDGIPGKNVTTVHFDQTTEDQNPPVLKMLQFRDAENNVTDRFEIPDEGKILFAGGDFDPRSIAYMTEYGYESNWDYNECQPMTIEVLYAPYGTDEWQPLEGIEHQEEYDDIPGLGFFYRGSLAGVTTPSENGWFDLKFRLVDDSGNWQEQTLSPAFRIDALVQSAVSEVRDGSAHEVARYSIDGKRVDTSHRGVTIIRMSDGTARKVIL